MGRYREVVIERKVVSRERNHVESESFEREGGEDGRDGLSHRDMKFTFAAE